MIVDKIKDSILFYAISGKLTQELDSDSNVNDYYEEFGNELKNTHNYDKINKSLLPISEEDAKLCKTKWKRMRLGSVIRINSGQGLTSKNMNIGNIPVYGGNGVTGYHDMYNVDEPTLVIGRVGYYCGVCHITPEFAWVTDNAFITTYPKKYFFEKYLYYLLNATNLSGHNNGTAQPVISGAKIYNIVVDVPPIEEQQRIVDKIEELFAKLDEIKPIEEELNKLKTDLPLEMNKSIIDYAIHGRLSNQNISDSDANNLIPEKSQLKDNYKKFNLTINEDEYPFQIPSNWIWVKLGMLFDYQNGYPYKPIETSKNGKGYPIIKSQNIMKRIVEINSKTSFVENPSSKMLKSKINKGDFLMCLSSQSNNPEPLGKTAIYEEEEFALLNQRVLKLTPINCNLSKYLYYVINSFYFHNTVSHKGGGSAQSNLKLEHVMEMYIPLPPIEEQQRIVDKLEQLLPLCDNIKKIIGES